MDGGEEFIILLPMTTGEDGTVAVQRILTETFPRGRVKSLCDGNHRSCVKPQELAQAFVHPVDQVMIREKEGERQGLF